MNDNIKRFLDPSGKIKIWPSKTEMKINILKYLSVFLKKGGREMFSNKHPGTPGF